MIVGGGGDGLSDRVGNASFFSSCCDCCGCCDCCVGVFGVPFGVISPFAFAVADSAVGEALLASVSK